MSGKLLSCGLGHLRLMMVVMVSVVLFCERRHRHAQQQYPGQYGDQRFLQSLVLPRTPLRSVHSVSSTFAPFFLFGQVSFLV